MHSETVFAKESIAAQLQAIQNLGDEGFETFLERTDLGLASNAKSIIQKLTKGIELVPPPPIIQETIAMIKALWGENEDVTFESKSNGAVVFRNTSFQTTLSQDKFTKQNGLVIKHEAINGKPLPMQGIVSAENYLKNALLLLIEEAV